LPDVHINVPKPKQLVGQLTIPPQEPLLQVTSQAQES
jgi:hypothetical protein